MEISPMRIFWMLVYAFAFGALCGIFNDINRLVRVLLGVRYGKERMDRLYSLKIPILGRPLKESSGRIKGVFLSAVIFVQDLLLMIFFGCGTVFINYSFNDGRVRIYTPLLVIFGFLGYYFSIGKIVIYFSENIAFALKCIFAVILSIFYRPIRIIALFFVKNIIKISKNLCKSLEKRKKMVYNNNKDKNVIKRASYGFVELHQK